MTSLTKYGLMARILNSCCKVVGWEIGCFEVFCALITYVVDVA